MDFSKILSQMDLLGGDMAQMRQKIATLRVSKETGAGLVKVTMDGTKKISALHIDQSLLSQAKQQMVQDLVMAAINIALDEVDHELQMLLQASMQDGLSTS